MSGFSERDRRRIAKQVKKGESNRGAQRNLRATSVPTAHLVLFKLGEVLTATAAATGVRMYPANPTDPDDLTWTNDDRGEKIYPWKMVGFKLSATKEVWCARLGGRWYAVIPEDCLEPA